MKHDDCILKALPCWQIIDSVVRLKVWVKNVHDTRISCKFYPVQWVSKNWTPVLPVSTSCSCITVGLFFITYLDLLFLCVCWNSVKSVSVINPVVRLASYYTQQLFFIYKRHHNPYSAGPLFVCNTCCFSVIQLWLLLICCWNVTCVHTPRFTSVSYVFTFIVKLISTCDLKIIDIQTDR